jgi:hypothetical protein
MPPADAEKTKRLVIEGLVLAFANSKARSLVGTDALRSVLGVQYRDLSRGGTFDLGPLAELFEGQPGYEPEPVSAALLRFKSWEANIGIAIKLPEGLAALSDADRADIMAQCTVPTSDVQKLYRDEIKAAPVEPVDDGYTFNDTSKAKEAKSKGVEPIKLPGQKASLASRVSPGTARILAVVGVLGIGFSGWYGYTRLRTNKPPEASISTGFAKGIPLSNAVQQINTVIATLSDEKWLKEPEKTRTKQLEEAFQALPPGADVIVIRDKSGKVRASAQRGYGKKPIVVKLM